MIDPVSYSRRRRLQGRAHAASAARSPDVIFATGYYSEAAIIVRQARELGMKMPILGGDGWVGDALKNGREALNNTYISNHYSGDNPDPIVQNFRKTYARSSTATPTPSPRSATTRSRCSPTRMTASSPPRGPSCATRSPPATCPA